MIALISGGESELVEFKIGACRDPMSGTQDNKMREKIIRVVASFMNTVEGGTVLIGIQDDGTIIGINDEYAVANKNKPNWDGYVLFLADVINNNLSIENPFQYYKITKHIIEGKDICKMLVDPTPGPVYFGKKLFVKTGNQTLERQGPDLIAFFKQRWPDG